jgi:hypothetical protein
MQKDEKDTDVQFKQQKGNTLYIQKPAVNFLIFADSIQPVNLPLIPALRGTRKGQSERESEFVARAPPEVAHFLRVSRLGPRHATYMYVLKSRL